MGSYVNNGQVLKLLPGKTLDQATKPSTGDVDEWIAEAEAEIDGALARAGFSVPVATARGVLILRKKVAAGVAARTKIALADGTPTNHENLRQEAELLKAEWDAFLAEIKSDLAGVAAMLGIAGGSGGSAASSFWTHPPAGETPPDPVFKTEEKW